VRGTRRTELIDGVFQPDADGRPGFGKVVRPTQEGCASHRWSSWAGWRPSSLHRACTGTAQHGVPAPSAPWRAQVAAMAPDTAQALSEAPLCPPPGGSAERVAETLHRSYAASVWTALLARIDEVCSLLCPHRGAPMGIIAFVTDTASVTRVLRRLGEPTRPPREDRPNGRYPLPRARHSTDAEAIQPAPAFEFHQILSG